jgi:hypothetical protein
MPSLSADDGSINFTTSNASSLIQSPLVTATVLASCGGRTVMFL